MPVSSELFTFTASPPSAKDTLVVHVPTRIAGSWELFRLLAAALKFPGYFGGNFDALDECLRDLSWLPAEQGVTLFHGDLPLLYGSHARQTYLEVLASALQHWQTAGGRQFQVIFPPATKL